MIPELLKQLEAQMTHSLSEIRLKFENSSNKGTGLEGIFRHFLRCYLPRTKSVGHGEIIDSFGHRSPQIDVAITFDNHPFTFTENAAGIFMIEGVAAIGEIKTSLTTDELRRTISVSQKTKELKRCLTKGSKLIIPPGFDQRFLNVPPYFLFAYESQITLTKICEILNEIPHTGDNPLAGTSFVDGVFVLNRGAILDFYPGSGLSAVSKDGTQLTGWVPFDNGDALRPLLDWLYATMYQVEDSTPLMWRYTGMKMEKEIQQLA